MPKADPVKEPGSCRQERKGNSRDGVGAAQPMRRTRPHHPAGPERPPTRGCGGISPAPAGGLPAAPPLVAVNGLGQHAGVSPGGQGTRVLAAVFSWVASLQGFPAANGGGVLSGVNAGVDLDCVFDVEATGSLDPASDFYTTHGYTLNQFKGLCKSQNLKSVKRWRVARVIPTTVITMIGLLATATPAIAAEQRIFSGSFGGAFSTTPAPLDAELKSPWGIAVNETTGNTYTADPSNNRVEEFTPTPTGEFVLMFGKEVNIKSGSEAEREVCTAKEACQPGEPGSTPGAFKSSGQAMFVAVDNSGGPSHGDVYVTSVIEANGPGNMVTKFDSEGHVLASWGVAGQLTSHSGEALHTIDGIAVDHSGNLWVSTKGLMLEFDENAALKTEWASPGDLPLGIAVGPEEHLYLDSGTAVSEFDSTGKLVGVITGTAIAPNALAVDAMTGDVYVETGEEALSVLRYAPGCVIRAAGAGCAPAESFSPGHLGFSHGLALDALGADDMLYASELARGEVAGFGLVRVPGVVSVRASGFGAGSAVLNGTVNPSGVPVTECFFEWGETEGYGQQAPCEHPDAGEVGAGENGVAVHADIAGLQQGTVYHFRLVAVNANDALEPAVGGDLTFGPPRVAGASTLEVNDTSVKLEGLVDPDNVDTRVQIEYGPQASYGQATGLVDVGGGGADVAIEQEIEGLTPGTEYHYRVFASNALGAAVGEDHAFTTQPTSENLLLLDGRRWEMVTPPNKHGAGILAINGGRLAIQAAAGGGAFTFLASAPTESGPAGNANFTQVLAGRGAGGVWGSRDLAIPHTEAVGATDLGEEYRVFSSDLSLGLVQPLGAFNPALSAEASEQTPYLHSSWLGGGGPGQACVVGCYRPLVSGAAGFENVPVGRKFGVSVGGGKPCPLEFLCGPQFEGASPDLEHDVLLSHVGLTAPETEGLFEWSAGVLSLVSVLPEGTPASEVGLGGHTTHIGSVYVALVSRRAVSVDGSRVVFSEGSDRLYLRDVGLEATVRLDKAQGVKEPAGAGAVYQDASADDSRVFFTDEQKLTPGAGAAPQKPDLYECQVSVREEEPVCTLHDLTPEAAGEPADVQGTSGEGTVLGAGEDGAAVYFVADGVLTGSEGNAHGEQAQAGQPNLYVSDDGVTSLVAVLSSGDSTGWADGEGAEPLPALTARVSPDGRWLAFLSRRSLTGFDNRDVVGGQPDWEVFLYHLPAGGGEAGSLVCVSCDPSGARPTGSSGVPGWTSPLYQSRYLSDGGRVFFDSEDALVPQDGNHAQDVYEYEPPEGAGAPAGDTCTAGSVAYSPVAAGCVGLVSSGSAPGGAVFLDASETGEEVFFLTGAQLALQDEDTSVDVYDAHVCSTSSPCPEEAPPSAHCVGDSCLGLVEAPADVTPGSLTFQGPGDFPSKPSGKPKTPAQVRAEKLAKALRVCGRERSKQKRARCVRRARRLYGPAKKAKKTARKTARRAARVGVGGVG
jgi:hypothetical protein